MFIDTIRISNFENPMGMALEPLTVSWKVREAVGKRAENVTLSVAMDPAMQNVILKKSGAALYLAGFLMFPIFGFNMVTFILTQLVFRKRRYNTFEEEEAAEVAEVTEAK